MPLIESFGLRFTALRFGCLDRDNRYHSSKNRGVGIVFWVLRLAESCRQRQPKNEKSYDITNLVKTPEAYSKDGE